MTIFHHKLITREVRVFGRWVNSSIIHDNMSSLIHNKCHPKSYHSDIEYHMPLNIPPTSCTHIDFKNWSFEELVMGVELNMCDVCVTLGQRK